MVPQQLRKFRLSILVKNLALILEKNRNVKLIFPPNQTSVLKII